MRKILPTRRSRLADLSLRCARYGVPVLVIAVLAHRSGLVATPQFLLAISLGSLIGLVALVGALAAMISLWRNGGAGWARALRALVYALVALLPLAGASVAFVQYPMLSDVSTDPLSPPSLGPDDTELPTQEQLALQNEAYPDLVTRRFRISPGELHQAALKVATQSGWQLTAELPPGMPDEPTRFQAVAVSPVFGFRDDVAVRILPDPVGARLDIRSASRVGTHDLGANARRIRGFFRDLDAVLLEAYGVIETVDEEVEGVAPDELPPLDPNAPAPANLPPPLPGFKPAAEAPLDTPRTSAGEDGQAGEADAIAEPEVLPDDLQEIYQEEPDASPATRETSPLSRLNPVAGQ
jgi:hypothetical protein